MSNPWRRSKKTKGKKRPGRRHKPDVKVLPSAQLKGIVAKAESISAEEKANLDAVIETLEWVSSELDNKTLTLARLRSLFGIQPSEKTKKLFDEGVKDPDADTPAANTDTPAAGLDPTPTSEGQPETAAPDAPKGHGRNGAADYTGAEVIEIGHESLKPGAPCPECNGGTVYEQRQRPKVVIRLSGQAPIKARIYRLQTLRCHLCGKIFAAKPPPGIGDAKYEPTAASMIALLKYGSGLPFNRLEGLEGHLGIPLPASTQWDVVAEAATALQPAYEELIREAARGRVVHNDDTSMRVLSHMQAIEAEKRASAEAGKTHKGRVGIFCTGVVSVGEHQIALFFTGRKHAGENLATVLSERSSELAAPIQMCDGLDRNSSAEFDVIISNCLVHARRKFVNAKDSFPAEVLHVLGVFGEVYKNDAATKQQGLSAAERLRFHDEHSAPAMTKLQAWMQHQIDGKFIEPNSSLGQAIAYMQKRWLQLTRFLTVPGAPLDNNICERALKKAILHRKNALFYKTENGARVGDLYMSLIHTAELVGANPFDYLTALISNADAVAAAPSEWLPWNYAATAAQS